MAIITALQEQREFWLNPQGRRMGFIRALRSGPDGENRLVSLLMDAKRAARDVARLPETTSGQLAAAMEELENNIHEHSDDAKTGLLAFRAAPGIFEFVAADRGIGILASLQRCPLMRLFPITEKHCERPLLMVHHDSAPTVDAVTDFGLFLSA